MRGVSDAILMQAGDRAFGQRRTANKLRSRSGSAAKLCRRAGTPHGIGSAVVDLIFSMANREVTFLSGTAAISRL